MGEEQKLKRKVTETEEEEEKEKEVSVSAGDIGMVVSYIFNPTRDKIREVTVVSPLQASLLPQLDINDLTWQYLIEIAFFRQDAEDYAKVFKRKHPIPPNLIEEYTYRMAQWNRSIAGQTMKSGIDLALAEMETKSEEQDFGRDSYEEDR